LPHPFRAKKSLQNQLAGEFATQGVHTPLIYFQEKAVWQYKYLAIYLQRDPVPDEKFMDELGADGWELACMFAYDQSPYIYFKRLIQV
jgi:hypothetical protein